MIVAITGIDGSQLPDNIPSLSIGEHMTKFYPWFRDESCHVVHAKDLIGLYGGSTRGRQKTVIIRIA